MKALQLKKLRDEREAIREERLHKLANDAIKIGYLLLAIGIVTLLILMEGRG